MLGNTLTKEKERYLKLYDAEIMRFDGNTLQCAHAASAMSDRNPERYCFLNQFNNLANLYAHYRTTGPEISREIPEVNVFVASMGSGGSLCGAGRYLKENIPGVKIIAVTAESGTRIPGLRNLEEEQFVPPLVDMDLIDDIITVNEEDAKEMVRLILKQEGLLLGYQGGAVVNVALRVARSRSGSTKNIVALMGDAGWKNLDLLTRKLISSS